MEDTFFNARKSQHIRSVVISNKEDYCFDLSNIGESWTGRIDASIANTFIMEAVQELFNSIDLFELGYFDCAYYSLRSAIDVSTLMIMLVDLTEDERETRMSDWLESGDYPHTRNEIIRQLKRFGNVYKDMLNKMPEFFEDAKQLSQDLNQFVHKKGFRYFYVSRNHLTASAESLDKFTETFLLYLEQCIRVVAVMRLVVDPFPIALMDDNLSHRCKDSLTRPYDSRFVEKYIGTELINRYKSTELYLGVEHSLLGYEKMTDATFGVEHYNFIDVSQLDAIKSQIHLLSDSARIAVKLVSANAKVNCVLANFGFSRYVTNRKSNKSTFSWTNEGFITYKESGSLVNEPYEGDYQTLIKGDEEYLVYHYEKLDDSELDELYMAIDDCSV